MFGAVLDRAPAASASARGRDRPAARRYLPGTNVLETTWQTPTGWLIVRDALIIGPWHHREALATHRRPPRRRGRAVLPLRTIKCVNGTVELELECEPVFDYGRSGRPMGYDGDGLPPGRRRPPKAATSTLRLTTNLRLGSRARSARRARR